MPFPLPGTGRLAIQPPASRRRLRRWSRRAGWGLLAVLLIVLLVGGWLLHSVLPYSILRPSRSERWAGYHDRTPVGEGLSAENIAAETEPGLWLRGWHVDAKQIPARGTIVLLHGHASCKEAELGLAKLFAAHGYHCLLYDARAHGESGGTYSTFGFYERRDLSRFLDEAERRFGPLGPVAVFGNSMGGAVALQAMADEPRIRCGIVESPFASLREIVRDYMEHFSGIPYFFLSDLALARAEQIAHFSADAVNPEAAARRIRQPVLLTHGTNDHWIAFRYGERIARQLNAPGDVWHPVPGADHDDLWKVGGEEYKQLILDFLDRHCR